VLGVAAGVGVAVGVEVVAGVEVGGVAEELDPLLSFL